MWVNDDPKVSGLRNLEEYSGYQQRKLQVEIDCSGNDAETTTNSLEIRINFKWTKYLDIKYTAIKLEDKTWANIYISELRKVFQNMT